MTETPNRRYLDKETLLQMEKLESLFTSQPDPIIIFNQDGSVDKMNNAAKDMLRFFKTPADTVGDIRKVAEFYELDDTPIPLENVPPRRILNGETLTDYRVKIHFNHRHFYIEINGRPLLDDEGRVLFAVMCFRNITNMYMASEIIQAQAKQLSAIMENTAEAFFIFDKDGNFTLINRAARALFMPLTMSLSKVDDLRRTFQFYDHHGAIIPPDETPAHQVLNGQVVNNARVCLKNDTTLIYMDVNGTPMTDENGDFVAGILSCRDVTAQVFSDQQYKLLLERQQSALIKSEALFRSVLENSTGIIYSLNPTTHHYEYVSPVCESVLGFTPQEATAMELSQVHALIHPEDRAGFDAKLANLKEDEITEIHYRFLTKWGEYRWLSNRMRDSRDGSGRLLRHGIVSDITEQVESTRVINYQATLLQSISDMIVSSDDSLRIKSWNKAAQQKLGWTETEAIGQNLGILLQLQQTESTFTESMERLETGTRIEEELVVTCKDGRKLHVIGSSESINDSSGNIIGFIVIFRDISDKKKAETALKEREMHLQLASEGAALATFTYYFDTKDAFLSPELKVLWGIDTQSDTNWDKNMLFKILHPDDRAKILLIFQEDGTPNTDGITALDFRIIRPDGTIRWMHARAHRKLRVGTVHAKPVLTAGIVLDITERVQAENSVRELSGELKNIIESTDDYIFSVDASYKLIFCNSSFYRYVLDRFGVNLSKGADIITIFTPESNIYWTDALIQAAREGKMQFDFKIDDGSRVITFSLNPVYVEGQLVEITIFGKDITERINSEREVIRLNASLEQRVLDRTTELQQTVKALQDLSRILSHDLKTPIREIDRYASMISESEDIAFNTKRIKKTCVSINKMIDDLSKYAQSSDKTLQLEPIHMKKLITTIYNDIKGVGATLCVLHFETGLPLVSADKVLIHHVLYNLLSNALKFSSKNSIADITVGCREENNCFVFYIKDNGVGFDMQYAHKLFTVFERLHSKSEFEGSGIGLAAVNNIILRHGGKTWIESQPNIGTTVYFTLPIVGDC